MARSSGKTTKKHVEAPVNDYEKQRLERIEANNKMCENWGIKRIVASMTSPLDSTKEKKGLIKSKSKVTLHRDSDYTPEDDPLDDDNDDEDNVAHKKRKVTSKKCMKKGMKRNFIPPKSIYNLLKHNNRQGNEYKGGNMHLTAAIRVLQQDDYEEEDMWNNEDREINEGNEDRNSQGNMVNNGKDILLEK